MCDRNGKAIGHSPKVLREYRDLLKDEFEVSAAVSPCLIKEAGEEFEQLIPLRFDICTDDMATLAGRIKDKFKLFYNIHEVLKLQKFDILWFYRTDFFLFFYFFFKLFKKKKRTVALVYQTEFFDGFLKNIVNFFYCHGAMRFDGLIYAQKGIKLIHPYMMFIPDYYYDADKYDKYHVIEKKDKVVCIGTMTPYKKLEELIEAFNKNGMILEIKGYFYEKERVNKLKEIKRDNILIEDIVLSEDEYYRTLAGAKYSVLPYDMKQYHSRTSGILQESIFVGTIPVAPTELLLENQIKGMGYSSIKELGEVSFFSKEFKPDSIGITEQYDKKKICCRLKKFLDGLG